MADCEEDGRGQHSEGPIGTEEDRGAASRHIKEDQLTTTTTTTPTLNVQKRRRDK